MSGGVLVRVVFVQMVFVRGGFCPTPVVCTGCFLFGLVGVTLGGGFGTLNKVGMAHHMIPAFLLSLFLNCDFSK